VSPKATGEGFVPQTPRHRPTSKRIRDFAKKMRREPTDAEAKMWRLLRDRRSRSSNFVGKFRFKILFSILSVSKSVSLPKSMAVSTRIPSVT
jgi:hypothetical protein